MPHRQARRIDARVHQRRAGKCDGGALDLVRAADQRHVGELLGSLRSRARARSSWCRAHSAWRHRNLRHSPARARARSAVQSRRVSKYGIAPLSRDGPRHSIGRPRKCRSALHLRVCDGLLDGRSFEGLARGVARARSPRSSTATVAAKATARPAIAAAQNPGAPRGVTQRRGPTGRAHRRADHVAACETHAPQAHGADRPSARPRACSPRNALTVTDLQRVEHVIHGDEHEQRRRHRAHRAVLGSRSP